MAKNDKKRQKQIHDLTEHGLNGNLMSQKAIEMNIKNILKKIDEIDKNPPETLTSLSSDSIGYKYKRMGEIAIRAFKGSPHLENVLKIINICHSWNIQAIESNTIGNQTPEERCGELSDMSKDISEAIGGGNVYKSIEFFKYNMISALSVTNMDSNTWEAIKNGAEPAKEFAMQTHCANCINKKEFFVANSKCVCGTTYCSKSCQKLHWIRGHNNTCTAVDRSKKKKCAECENPNPGNTCSCCKLVHYCDEKCQKLNWTVHKLICKKAMPEATMAEATMAEATMEKTVMAEITMEKTAMVETAMVKKRKKSKKQKSATAMEKTAMAETAMVETTASAIVTSKTAMVEIAMSETAMVETTASAIVTSETATAKTALLKDLDAENTEREILSFLEEVIKQEIFEKSKKYANEF